jgi:hypothetical protein
MKITATMLYFLNEEDAERFDAENRNNDDAYFQGLLPETMAHFVNQVDLEGDDHAWLADMGYDHEEGFEITFSDLDGNDLRAAILSGLLEHGYTVCAWSDRLLIRPGTLRVQHMVEMDLLHAMSNISDKTAILPVQAAFDFVEDTRSMLPGRTKDDETGGKQVREEQRFRIYPGRFYALDEQQASEFDAAQPQGKKRFAGMCPGGNAYLLDYDHFDPLVNEDFDPGDPETGCTVEFDPIISREQQLALCSGLIAPGYAVCLYPNRLLLVPWHRDVVTEVARRDIEQLLSDGQRRMRQ